MKEIQLSKNVFISDLYCIYLSDENAVVVSDLHLGFEEEMNLRGLFLPKLQRDHVEGIMDKIIDRYDPSRVIINGDFKHEFARNLPQEWEDVTHFVDRYRKQVNLVFVRGNHDNYLMTMLARRKLEMVDVYETESYYIYHGDRDRGLKKLTILGHEHPALILRDSVGGTFKIPAFVFNEKNGVLITPSMSFFSSGTDVSQSLLSDEHFTPVLKKTEPENFRVYGLTDEFGLVDFGNLPDLQVLNNQKR